LRIFLPPKIIDDKAYDRDPHDNFLAEKEIERIVPHRKKPTKPKTQDLRKLKHYKKRGAVE
jgi:hypothetical protein